MTEDRQWSAHDGRDMTAAEWSCEIARLDTVLAGIKAGWGRTPVSGDEVLAARAGELARVPETARTPGESLDVCLFRLGPQVCAIESRFVSSVFVLKEYTMIPCVPPHVLGVVSLRGSYLAVIDLGRFFGLPEKGLSDFSKVVAISSDQREFGFVTGEIIGSDRLEKSSLRNSQEVLPEVDPECVMGVTGKGVLVLDAARLLTSDALRIHDEI